MSSANAKPSALRARHAPPPKLDGRVERTRVTREKIVLALLDLIRAGNLSPTSDDVARYASVGDRTIFRHFRDLEELFAEMHAKVRSLVLPVLTESFCEGPLAQRIDQLVSARSAMFEQITAYYLSGETRLHISPTVQRARVQMAAQQRRQLLACLPEVEARPEVAAAIEMLTSIEGWIRFRRTQGLSAKQSKMTILAAVGRLLRD